MSYDTLKSRNRRAGKDWAAHDQELLMEDIERGNFLRKLDFADIEITDFEARFIENFLSNKSLNWWTPGRRTTCDQMRQSYKGRL
jgi:hypothetical protein